MHVQRRSVPRKQERPLFVRRLFDESDLSMVFDQSTGKICIVNSPTRIVWNMCDGRRSWGDIVDCLCEKSYSQEELEEAVTALYDQDWISFDIGTAVAKMDR